MNQQITVLEQNNKQCNPFLELVRGFFINIPYLLCKKAILFVETRFLVHPPTLLI